MKVAVLVSGGVDSSVALALLKKQGYDVTAFYLKIWLEDELSYLGDCPWEEDLSYARAVCEKLAVPLEVVSLQKEYQERVVAYTIAEVRAGRTPNPDMLCNQYIKFGLFLDKIDPSFAYVATGHYAQLIREGDAVQLVQAPDSIKDQTYFLARMSQAQLKRALFPIGHLQKSEVRALAHEFDLPTKDRKDSQGICFLGKFKFRDFILHHLGMQEGNLVEFETGEIWGTHDGFWFYTIGQRQGLRLAGGPWYVVSKDPDTNTVFISRDYYAADKKRNTLRVTDCMWYAPVAQKTNLLVKLRHGAHKHDAQVHIISDGTADVQLLHDDQGIAPGQFAVFYNDDVCVGSGIITA